MCSSCLDSNGAQQVLAVDVLAFGESATEAGRYRLNKESIDE